MGKRRKNDFHKVIFKTAVTLSVTFIAAFVINSIGEGLEKDLDRLNKNVLDSSTMSKMEELSELAKKASKEISRGNIIDSQNNEERGNAELIDDNEHIPLFNNTDTTWEAESKKNTASLSASASLSLETNGKVIKASDGETLLVNIGGDEVRLRLIGIDVPENITVSDYTNDYNGNEKVSDIINEMFSDDKNVTIEYDSASVDKYGRTLAYVYLSDGTMLNEWLLENGYAQTLNNEINTKHQEEFINIEKQAIKNKVGLWNGYFTQS